MTCSMAQKLARFSIEKKVERDLNFSFHDIQMNYFLLENGVVYDDLNVIKA